VRKRPAIVLGGVLIAMSGAAAFVTISVRTQEASAVGDPRREAPIVRLVTPARVTGPERAFTGIMERECRATLVFASPVGSSNDL
jgi:hypothetical protein